MKDENYKLAISRIEEPPPIPEKPDEPYLNGAREISGRFRNDAAVMFLRACLEGNCYTLKNNDGTYEHIFSQTKP